MEALDQSGLRGRPTGLNSQLTTLSTFPPARGDAPTGQGKFGHYRRPRRFDGDDPLRHGV
jgi:hypothetical protein